MPTFTTPLHSVWNAPLNRHSAPSVGNAAVGRPTRLKAVGLACAMNVGHPLQCYHAHLLSQLLPQCFQCGAGGLWPTKQKGANPLDWRLLSGCGGTQPALSAGSSMYASVGWQRAVVERLRSAPRISRWVDLGTLVTVRRRNAYAIGQKPEDSSVPKLPGHLAIRRPLCVSQHPGRADLAGKKILPRHYFHPVGAHRGRFDISSVTDRAVIG